MDRNLRILNLNVTITILFFLWNGGVGWGCLKERGCLVKRGGLLKGWGGRSAQPTRYLLRIFIGSWYRLRLMRFTKVHVIIFVLVSRHSNVNRSISPIAIFSAIDLSGVCCHGDSRSDNNVKKRRQIYHF